MRVEFFDLIALVIINVFITLLVNYVFANWNEEEDEDSDITKSYKFKSKS